MMAYVAVPARLIGAKREAPRRDRLITSLLSSVLAFTICTPPYLLGRLGIVMVDRRFLLVPGIIALAELLKELVSF